MFVCIFEILVITLLMGCTFCHLVKNDFILIFGYSLLVEAEDVKFGAKVYVQSQKGFCNLLRIQTVKDQIAVLILAKD